MMQLWPRAARFALLVLTDNIMMYTLLCRAVRWKHKPYWCIALALSSVCIKTAFTVFLANALKTSAALRFVYALIVVAQIVVLIPAFAYMFSDSLSKTLMFMVPAEIIASMIGIASLAVVNAIEGNPLTCDDTPIGWVDLLLPVLAAALFSLFLFLTGKWLSRLRRMELRCEKLWLAVWIFWGTFAIVTVVDQNLYNVKAVGQIYIFMAVFLGVVYAWVLIDVYEKQEKARRAYLKRQQQLFALQYEAVGRQVAAMEQARRTIDAQMCALQETGEDGSPLNDRLREYLQELKELSNRLGSGMYCNDWLVDSTLYQEEMRCRQAGIAVDIRMQGFACGSVDEEDAAALLSYLFAEARAAQSAGTGAAISGEDVFGRHVLLRTGQVANCLVFCMTVNACEASHFSGKPVRGILRKYNGSLQKHSLQGQDGVQVEVVLQKAA